MTIARINEWRHWVQKVGVDVSRSLVVLYNVRQPRLYGFDSARTCWDILALSIVHRHALTHCMLVSAERGAALPSID